MRQALQLHALVGVAMCVPATAGSLKAQPARPHLQLLPEETQPHVVGSCLLPQVPGRLSAVLGGRFAGSCSSGSSSCILQPALWLSAVRHGSRIGKPLSGVWCYADAWPRMVWPGAAHVQEQTRIRSPFRHFGVSQGLDPGLLGFRLRQINSQTTRYSP